MATNMATGNTENSRKSLDGQDGRFLPGISEQDAVTKQLCVTRRAVYRSFLQPRPGPVTLGKLGKHDLRRATT